MLEYKNAVEIIAKSIVKEYKDNYYSGSEDPWGDTNIDLIVETLSLVYESDDIEEDLKNMIKNVM